MIPAGAWPGWTWPRLPSVTCVCLLPEGEGYLWWRLRLFLHQEKHLSAWAFSFPEPRKSGKQHRDILSSDPLHSSELQRQLPPECGYLVTMVPVSLSKEVRSPLQGSTTCAPSSNQSHPMAPWALDPSPSGPMLSPYLETNQYPVSNTALSPALWECVRDPGLAEKAVFTPPFPYLFCALREPLCLSGHPPVCRAAR